MSKKILTILALSAAAFGAAACSTYDTPITKAPGVYKTSSESENPNGTDTKTKQTTSVYRDGYGDKKAVVKTETTKDPEGLFNKSTTTTVKKYE